MQFSLDMVREVARLLHESDLAEISLETSAESSEPARLTVRRVATAAPRRMAQRARQHAAPASPLATNAPVAEPTDEPASAEAVLPVRERITLRATAVGLFRQAAPLLQVGDGVRAKQVLGSVESMKIPTEIEAPVAGQVIEVLVEEGAGVEYNQPLMVLEVV